MTNHTTASINFADTGSCYAVYKSIADREFIVDIQFWTAFGHDHPGDRVMVLSADDDGIVVCELDDNDEPMRFDNHHISYEDIRTLTIR